MVTLITQHYIPDDLIRQSELNLALLQNLRNPLIQEIHLLNEAECDLGGFDRSKITEHIIGDRITYESAFDYASERLSDRVCVLANFDIYFDESLMELDNQEWEDTIVCVSRHDLEISGEIVPLGRFRIKKRTGCINPHRSHDAWFFKSPLKKFNCGFQLGVGGCETNMVYWATQAGLKCLNGFPYVRAIHAHWSQQRTWKRGYPFAKELGPKDALLREDIRGKKIRWKKN